MTTQRGGNNSKKEKKRKIVFFISTREVVENYPGMDRLWSEVNYRIEFCRSGGSFPELRIRMGTGLKLMVTLWNSIKTVDKSATTDPP